MATDRVGSIWTVMLEEERPLNVHDLMLEEERPLVRELEAYLTEVGCKSKGRRTWLTDLFYIPLFEISRPKMSKSKTFRALFSYFKA